MGMTVISTFRSGVHLIVTVVTIAVIAQKWSISAIAERSPSHAHPIVPIVQKTFWLEIKISMKWTWTAVHLGNMTIVLIVHDRWPVSIWSFRSFTTVNIGVSIWSLWLLTEISAIIAIVTITWIPGFTPTRKKLDFRHVFRETESMS